MKAIIIDDEAKSRKLIQIIIQENCKEIDEIFEASDLESGVALIKQQQPHLVFLDIEMPKYSGLQILEFFQPFEINFQIIFITAYNEYALRAFKLAAVDYLLKPIDKTEFIQAVQKAKTILENEKVNQNLEELKKAFQQLSLNKIALEIPKGVLFVSHDDILLFEADGMYTKVYLKEGQSQLICKPLKHFVEQLQQKAIFYKPHRSYLINLKHLKEFSKNEGFYLIMENNKSIPLSKEKKEEFLNLINDVF
ncbi:Two component transcriptional regulator, LytTR family [Flavobacterium sp. 9AF]|uniref:LytR/AlgR family response regulator transcription factor n=1 Tax=Flavobacterium sp. 9AF TaxID=2653142 RepID=UPI0012F20749|nr:LytTR family DNA-binding domain-containing protein [Flavobacterium sp. 9AF]VXB44269.1 Two component transcriptional regulator, LytTR family [Flavobacterium sp. 9AF]